MLLVLVQLCITCKWEEAIESGSARFVVVGGAEAPITPEIVDGF